MKNKKLGLIIFLLSAVLMAALLTYLYPTKRSILWKLDEDIYNPHVLLKQKILAYENEEKEYYKLYKRGQLVGVISDYQKILKAIDDEYEEKYEDKYPDCGLALEDGLYVAKENVYYRVEDIDDKIIEYLKAKHLGIKVKVVEFSTEGGVYEAIYVKSIEMFNNAQSKFLENFVSDESLQSFKRKQEFSDLTSPGTKDIDLVIQENINFKEAVAHEEDILQSEDEIYDFLCYGRNKEREYYTVQDGDTLSGIGSRHKNYMSARQIMMLNRDKINDINQVLVKGTVLNIKYYTSPLTVVVTKQRLVEEVINPEPPQYIEDPDLYENQSKVITAEDSGSRNVLHEEKWINGVQQEGSIILSSIDIKQPIQAVIRVGNKRLPNVGTGNFVWPIDNVSITCGWACYPGHTGTDLQNMYNRYDNVYAADTGTVIRVGYDSIGGNWIVIDHNNGYETYYGHLNVPAFPNVGEVVSRGQIIGQIGMTGLATGPHTHFEIRINHEKVDACTIMNCESVPWR